MGTVEAVDADQTEVNHRISFFFGNGNGSSNFLLRTHRLGPGHYEGRLSLDPDVPLDYEQLSQPVFNLTVQAENAATDDTLTVVSTVVQVYIIDVNDESPTIQPSPLPDARVAENSTGPQLEEVTTVQASDPDTKHMLSFQELGLSCYKGAAPVGSVCHAWFHLDPNGSVFANRSEIDYEACDLALLALRVHDNSTKFGNAYSQNGRAWLPAGDATWGGQGAGAPAGGSRLLSREHCGAGGVRPGAGGFADQGRGAGRIPVLGAGGTRCSGGGWWQAGEAVLCDQSFCFGARGRDPENHR